MLKCKLEEAKAQTDLKNAEIELSEVLQQVGILALKELGSKHRDYRQPIINCKYKQIVRSL